MAEFALHPPWITTLDKEAAIFIRQGHTFHQQDGSRFLDLLDKAIVRQDPGSIRWYLDAGTSLE